MFVFGPLLWTDNVAYFVKQILVLVNGNNSSSGIKNHAEVYTATLFSSYIFVLNAVLYLQGFELLLLDNLI